MKTVKNAKECYIQILDDVLKEGHESKAGTTKSAGSEKITKDLWNYSIRIEKPHESVIQSKISEFRTACAVSRFIWMMGANNRIKDIEFYWGKNVGRFSDDEIIMPGSNYGARMITPRPGMNQIESIIKRLKEDPTTRRAAISIYHPEDAVRDSKDIPCAFGIFYTIRDGELLTTIFMRSNNAKLLFPYNIFEFSLLSNVIANEVGVKLGAIHFQSVSMHLYDYDFKAAKEIIDEDLDFLEFSNPIPDDNNPLSQIKELIKLEADLRHGSKGITKENVEDWISKAKTTVDGYWLQHYLVLMHYVATKVAFDNEVALIIYNELEPKWQALLTKPVVTKKSVTQNLFGDTEGKTISIQENGVQKQIEQIDGHCKNNKEVDGKKISLTEYLELKKRLINSRTLAARDGNMISEDQVVHTLKMIRNS